MHRVSGCRRALRAVFAVAASFACATAVAVTFTAQPSVVQSYLQDGGFETPNFPAAGWAQGPALTSTFWTAVHGGGIGANGSPWATGLAPEGDQYGILQGPDVSTLTQTFNAPAGRYRLTFKAAQRPDGSAQTITLLVDGVPVGTATPASTAFEDFTFDALKLASAGSHSLTFRGTSSLGHSVAIDDVKFVSATNVARRWEDASTWNQGALLPTKTSDVVIPAGSVVLLPPSASAKSISVNGELHCNDAHDTTLASERVTIMGRLTCGSPSAPYLNRFVLTLKGSDAEDFGGMGIKFLAAMGAGRIELHGQKRTSFVRLRRNANVGDTVIVVEPGTGWNPGDKLVLAPTRYGVDANGKMIDESEEATIFSIGAPNVDGNIPLTLAQPLGFVHYGTAPTVFSKPDHSHSWSLDQRADVGLLTRNIVIQGDDTSDEYGYGGHMMSMRGSSVRVSGIELYRMGQKGRLARYPFHWHLVRDAPGQYIENSSIHRSYNRCVTVHGTNRVRVADNVCYDFVGHGYFLENGNEKYNTFDHNLGVAARRPPPPPSPEELPIGVNVPDLPLETDRREGPASSGPSVFWISHPTNTYTNNSAAGSEGSAYWYHLEYSPFDPPPEPDGSDLPPDAVAPTFATFGVFDNNRAYASRQGFSSCFDGGGPLGMNVLGSLVTRLTATSVGQGIWPCGSGHTRFHEAIVANTENGMQAPQPMSFSDSLFVSYTDDNRPARAAFALDVPWTAVTTYDQGFDLDNIHFVNYNGPAMSVFITAGGAGKSPGNRATNLSFENSPNIYRDIIDAWKPGGYASFWGEVINSLDDTLIAGDPATHQPRALVTAHPMMTDATCSRPTDRGIAGMDSGVGGYGCPYRYAVFMTDEYLLPGESGNGPTYTMVRSDGVHDTSFFGGITLRIFGTYIVGPYRYGYRYLNGIKHNRIQVTQYWSQLGTAGIHELHDVPASVKAVQSAVEPWTQVYDMPALEAATGNAYYHRGESNSLFVKIFSNRVDGGFDATWEAYGYGLFCLDGAPACVSCPVGGNCPIALRSVHPPSVTITSPADKARIAPGLAVVTAQLADPVGLQSARLWVGESMSKETTYPPNTFSATSTLSVEVAAGSYPVKLVVKNTNGETFTAIQQIHVGDIAPRVEITAPLWRDGATFFGTAVPNLTFATHNWSAPDEHVHWFVDGVDQGHATGTIALNNLAQGRHTIEVALARGKPADATHHIYPMREVRTVHIVRDGWLADYEDGIDPRGKLVRHLTTGDAEDAINWYPTPPRVARAITAVDDLNYFYLPTSGTVGPRATYTLTLDPPLDFSAYAKLEVKYKISGFDAYLRRAGSPTLVPMSPLTAVNVGADTVQSFNLPAGSNAQVTAVVLRFPNSGTACCLNQFNLSGIRLTNP